MSEDFILACRSALPWVDQVTWIIAIPIYLAISAGLFIGTYLAVAAVFRRRK